MTMKPYYRHVYDCNRVLPSNKETFGKHVFDSMNCSAIDELIPCDCINSITCKSHYIK